MRKFRIATAASLLMTGISAGPAVTPSPTSLACGSTVSTDVQLDGDISCPDGNGLSTDGAVTIDLNGYSLEGPGDGTGAAVTRTGLDAVTVKNGIIRGWGTGATSDDWWGEGPAPVNVIEGVRFEDNATGVGVYRGEFTVRSSTFVGQGVALWAFYGTIRARDSTFVRNDSAGHAAESLITFSDSRFVDNDRALTASDGGFRVERSTFVRNGTVYSGWRSGSQFVDSTFNRNDVVLYSQFGSGDEFVDNRFTNNRVVVDSAADVYLRGNVFTGNDVAVRAVEDPDRGYSSEPLITMIGNRLSNNGDAVEITYRAALGSNTVVRNSGYGIYAPKADDLGGNIARRNGVEPQCTGVVCASR